MSESVEATGMPVPGPEPIIARRRTSPLVVAWLWSLPVFVLGPALVPQMIPFEILLPFGLADFLIDVESLSLQAALYGLVLWAGLSVHWAPTLVASGRFTLNRGWVFGVNLLLGWTLVGWVVAFAMAFSSEVDEQAKIRSVDI